MLGVAAAIECIRRAKLAEHEAVCYHIMPAVDLENVQRNAEKVVRSGSLAALLELASPNDFEHEPWNDSAEAEAMRTWLETAGSVDAYLSFHAAACLSAGAFFYVQGASPFATKLIDQLRMEAGAAGIPLGPDPTGVPSRKLGPGFYELSDLDGGALAHVHGRFRPSVSLVSEIPVGFVGEQSSLAEYHAVSRRYAADVSAGRPTDFSMRLLDPTTHVAFLAGAAMCVGKELNFRLHGLGVNND